MIELVAATASFVLGYVLAGKRRGPPARETMLALRHAPGASGGYREASHEVVSSLEELRRCLDTAGLVYKVEHDELRVRRGVERIRILVADPRRVTLGSLDVFQLRCDLLGFEVALALVPVFGPIRLVDAMFGAYAVDRGGTAAALATERGERISAIASAIAEDMDRKMAIYRGLGGRS
jgi:hypothetical protein